MYLFFHFCFNFSFFVKSKDITKNSCHRGCSEKTPQLLLGLYSFERDAILSYTQLLGISKRSKYFLLSKYATNSINLFQGAKIYHIPIIRKVPLTNGQERENLLTRFSRKMYY